jgi:EmrB/QacA subfamily drug resistance transporter
MAQPEPDGDGLGRAAARWVLVASVLGSGAVFLEGTVVSVALPAIARDFGLGIEGLQWVMNGYLVTLSALMLLGGALGDSHQRNTIFIVGCVGFAVTSAACALAPGVTSLVVFRVLQGAAGALLVPNSLAMVETAFHGEARGAAIGQWAAWSGVASAAGPLLGGWLTDVASWRWVFAGIIVFSLAAAAIAVRHSPSKPESQSSSVGRGQIDYLGAVLGTLGLAGVVGALTAGPSVGFTQASVLAAGLGGIALIGWSALNEHQVASRGGVPLLPVTVFKSRQFTGANVTTVLVYAALNGLFFLLMPQLQTNLGYSALAAGAALLPVFVLLLVISPIAGRVGARIGPRIPMTIGAMIAALGMQLFARVQPGTSYVDAVLPAVLVFGFGLAVFVAPLTSAVLEALDERQAGIASGINNAVARLAGLVATAVLPLAAGLGGVQLGGAAFAHGYARAMSICAGLCVLGGLVALATVRDPLPKSAP